MYYFLKPNDFAHLLAQVDGLKMKVIVSKQD